MKTTKEKTIKFLNMLLNAFLYVRHRILLMHGIGRSHLEGVRMIKKSKYQAQKFFRASDFYVTDLQNWGSARPDTDHACSADNAELNDRTVLIITERRDAVGRGWNAEKVERHAVSGEAHTREPLEAVGMYSAFVKFDQHAIGSWDAFWFLHINDQESYEEFDIERMFAPHKRFNQLTASVHRGTTSEQDRRMFNFAVRIPKDFIHLAYEFRKKTMRIYVNGVCVFIALQHRVTTPIRMIIGSGIGKGHLDYCDKIFRYEFKVFNIQHHREIES